MIRGDGSQVRRRPARTCVACREEAGKTELVRVVRRPDGSVAFDRSGKEAGRGAYLHAARECLETARKRRLLDRALRASVPTEVWEHLPV